MCTLFTTVTKAPIQGVKFYIPVSIVHCINHEQLVAMYSCYLAVKICSYLHGFVSSLLLLLQDHQLISWKQTVPLYQSHYQQITMHGYQWLQLIASCPTPIHMPQEAHTITTPMLYAEQRSLLAEHPYPELVLFFTSGISNGFRVSFRPPQSCQTNSEEHGECLYSQGSGR